MPPISKFNKHVRSIQWSLHFLPDGCKNVECDKCDAKGDLCYLLGKRSDKADLAPKLKLYLDKVLGEDAWP